MNDNPHLFAGLVGTGFIGPVHIEALRRLARPVLGIVGSTPEKSRQAAQLHNITRAYDTFDDLIADPLIRVVHLATPNRMHFDQCKKALAAGKHILCEKPLAMTSTETAQLVELSRQAPIAAAVCYNVRYYPLCLEARQRITDGSLGSIHHVTGSYQQDWLLHESDFNWRVLASEGGPLRAVADIGTHWMDLVSFVTGLAIESVCADLRTFLPERRKPKGNAETFAGKHAEVQKTEAIAVDTEDYGSVLLHLGGGARGVFTVSQVTAGRKNSLRFEVAGSNGSLAWDSEHPNEMWLGHRDSANEVLIRDPALLQAPARRYANFPGGHNEGFPDTFKQLFRSFYEYIEAGDLTETRPFPTFEDGHQEVLLCEAILESHTKRGWVDLSS
jgi:predicted dehydrogenase